jgi:chemotaxis protein MotA
MFIIIGYLILCGSIYGGFAMSGGHLPVLFQPLLLLMVGGGGMGYFYSANNIYGTKQVLLSLPEIFKSDRLPANTLTLLDIVLAHLANGDHGAAAKAVLNARKARHTAQSPHADVLGHMAESIRLAGLPGTNAEEFARLSETAMHTYTAETARTSQAVCNLGHVMVAMGLLVSVLGIIHASQVASGPDFVHLIGISLVGAFLGILIGWGFVLAIGHAIRAKQTILQWQFHCIDLAMGAHLRGLPAALALEAGRLALPVTFRGRRNGDRDNGD